MTAEVGDADRMPPVLVSIGKVVMKVAGSGQTMFFEGLRRREAGERGCPQRSRKHCAASREICDELLPDVEPAQSEILSPRARGEGAEGG